MQRTAYSPSSAYRSETGGLMEALRVLTADTIRDYHGSYYLPHNLCLIVAGKLSTEALLDVLQKEVEPTIVQHGQAHGSRPENWKRPFMETPSAEPPIISGMMSETVEFPEKDESSGELAIYFVGPRPQDRLTMKVSFSLAFRLAWSYL
jgi:Zn-dependent M16 (insulinase) family peptidase